MRSNIKGAEALMKKLQDLDTKMARQIARDATREAAKVIAAAAKAAAPVASGATQKAIKVRALKRSRSRIGANAMLGSGWFKGTTFYAAFQELGYQLKNGKKMPGKHWFKNAFESAKGQAAEVWKSTMEQGIKDAADGR